MGSVRVEQPRRVSGAAGLVQLGVSRAALIADGRVDFGTFTAYHQPWFEIVTGSGVVRKCRAHEALAALLFDPSDFCGRPELFFYDFSAGNPGLVPGWVKGCVDYHDRDGALVPLAWVDPDEAAGASCGSGAIGGPPAAAPASSDSLAFIAHERVELHRAWVGLAGSAWASSTLAGLRNPGLKALWFFASRRFPLPPPSSAVVDYLTWLAAYVDTTGAVETARQAINLLCDYNGWDTGSVFSGRASIPAAAMRRRHAHETKKAPGLPLTHVRAILRAYAFVRPELPWYQQWCLALGVAIGTSYKTLARYDDLARLRYDSGYFEIHYAFIRLLFDRRKTHQEGGMHIDVARPALQGDFGVYHALEVGHRTFGGSGYILPHIDAQGTVHRERPMSYDDYSRHLRAALVFVGVSAAEAAAFTPHSARAGAATEGAQHLRPEELCHLAGTKDPAWFMGYLRRGLLDRLRLSWALGL